MVTVRLRSLPTSYHLMLLAYIDTALGSMLLQAMAGMIFAAIVMGRRTDSGRVERRQQAERLEDKAESTTLPGQSIRRGGETQRSRRVALVGSPPRARPRQ